MKLVVLMDRRILGEVEQDGGRFRLTYDRTWREDRASTPLSLSMPLRSPVHQDPVVRAFLWGLLPDNRRVLERWAQRYSVSDQNPFALLRHVGEDCAGAAQLVPPDLVEDLLAGEGGVEWVDDNEIASRLKELRQDPTAWSTERTGQFSLAGAQAKTALYFDPVSRRWGYPHGAVPTTHILKPAIAGLDDHDLNEHLCLGAARRLGIRASPTSVQSFAQERAIVVERYDRRRRADRVRRIHQEDLCQALGLEPTKKYQNEGGPSPEQIGDLLRKAVRPVTTAHAEVERFADALAYNWLIAGTDAHAKNYSVLLSGRDVRLAPLYDVASVLPYRDHYLPKLPMAMKAGDEYRLEWIHGRHWRRLAESLALDGDALIERIDRMAAQLPECLAAVAAEKAVQELRSDLPEHLVELVAARATECRSRLGD